LIIERKNVYIDVYTDVEQQYLGGGNCTVWDHKTHRLGAICEESVCI